jgi:hypothetical protein
MGRPASFAAHICLTFIRAMVKNVERMRSTSDPQKGAETFEMGSGRYLLQQL